MKPRFLRLLVATALLGSAGGADAAPRAAAAGATAEKKVVAVGTRPESVTRGFGGKLFVTVMNDGKTPGDGVVKVLEGEQARDFATGLDEPKGICFTGKHLVTTDLKKVWRIDAKGDKSVLADESAFPHPVSYLNDTACEPGGKAVYVTDMGANTKMRDAQNNLWPLDSPEARALPALGRVYRIGLDGKVTLALDTSDDMKCPNGVSVPAKGRLLVGEFFHGNLLEARGKTITVLATGYRGADAIEQDRKGNIYVSSWQQGKVWRFDRRGKNEALLLEGLQSAADFYLDEKAGQLVVPDMKAGTLTFLPIK
jgi:hypothetical protein